MVPAILAKVVGEAHRIPSLPPQLPNLSKRAGLSPLTYLGGVVILAADHKLMARLLPLDSSRRWTLG